MGKPAARIGDMTAHGGSIVMGYPTVLIGGMPAARLLDMHVCPMLTPCLPPIPHVGGPVLLGSAGVLIGGMPAARMGDMAMCVGPPDVIVLGCFTVLIGETMAGAAKPPGPIKVGLSSAAVAHIAAATALSDNTEASTKLEHWVDFEFVDKAGKPVSGVHYKFTDPDGKESKGVLRPDGRICRDALNAGQCKAQLFSVHSAEWSKDKAQPEEKVKLTAKTYGFNDGTKGIFQIYKRDINQPDVVIATLETQVKDGKIEAEWENKWPGWAGAERTRGSTEKEQTSYSDPIFYFEALVEHCRAKSGIFIDQDWTEIKLLDEEGKPIRNVEFTAILPSGEIKKGKLDAQGKVKIEKVAPGQVRIKFDKRSLFKGLSRKAK